MAEGEQLRTAVLPGLELAVRVRPPLRTGLPPALFVHGLGGSSQNWSELMAQLADTVDGEALDLPGFGWSPPPPTGTTPSPPSRAPSSGTSTPPGAARSTWSGTPSAEPSPPASRPSGPTWCAP